LKLKDFQDRFQRAILEGDDGILADIPDGPHETKSNLLGIYRDAYALRLIEVIGNDHELMRRYLGEQRFGEMARAYIASCPSNHPNARWFAHKLPEFLRATEPYASRPILAELAALERALNDAFDGADAPVLSMTDLAAIPPEIWGQLAFVRHPTAIRLKAHTNVAEIWATLKADEEPTPSTHTEDAIHLLVWRHDTTPMFRKLPAEEAMMWDEASKGRRFGDLCEMLATYDDPAGAPARAAGYLKAWLDAGALSEVVLPC
jgi:Putative DNA-binding domain